MSYGQQHHILSVECTLLFSLVAIMSLCVHHLMLYRVTICITVNANLTVTLFLVHKFIYPLLHHHHPPQPFLPSPTWTISHCKRAGCGWRNPLLPSLTFKTTTECGQRFCRWLLSLYEADLVPLREVCVCQKERERERGIKCKREWIEQGESLSSLPLIPLCLYVKSPPPIYLLFFFQTIMEQFNPCLRNFVAMGKNYEKALASKCFFSIYFLCAPCFVTDSGTQPSQHSVFLFLFLSFSMYISIYLSFLLTLKKDKVNPPAEWAGLVMWCTASAIASTL